MSIAVGAFLVTAEVISRKLFAYALLDIVTLGRMVMLIIGFLAAGYTLRMGRHVAVEVVAQVLPKRLGWWIRIVADVISLLFLAVFTKLSFDFAWSSYLIGTESLALPGVPIWPFKVVVPIGLGVLTLELLLEIAHKIKTRSLSRNSLMKGSRL